MQNNPAPNVDAISKAQRIPPHKIVDWFENRPEIGKTYFLKKCDGGYLLPPELEGQRGRVVGTQNYSYRVRALGKEWILPPQLIDAGSTYIRADGKPVDKADRQVAKRLARAAGRMVYIEARRNIVGKEPF